MRIKVQLSCTACGRDYFYSPSRGHIRKLCNSCSANRSRIGFKERVVQYLGGRCSRCGYSRCVHVLHAHHKDPTAKLFSVSGSHCRRWDLVRTELDKCELLCANCHGEEHAKKSWGTLYKERPTLPERYEVAWPNKSHLKKMVETMPMTAIARKIGVSDRAVAKHLEKVGIPHKTRGEWGHNGTKK